MAERHSSENGQHGGPGLPMFCGVIGAGSLAMAAMAILMTGQMSTSQMRAGGPGAANATKSAASSARVTDRIAP